MTTMLEIVERAYRKIGVVAEDEAPTAAQMQNGLAALNSMMSGWSVAGVEFDHADNTSGGSDFPLGARWVQGTVHMLAQEIAPDFGLAFDGAQFLRALQAHTATIPNVQHDLTLTSTPSQRFWTR